MKKLSIALILAVGTFGASGAFAGANTAVCDGTGSTVSVASNTSGFVKQAFNMKCSNNVFLKYDDETDATLVGVCAASSKGNQKYGGTSNGGQVSGTAVTGAITSSTVASNQNGCS